MTSAVGAAGREPFAGVAVVVTGAARGIGRAVLSAFTAAGANVVAVDQDPVPLQEAVAACAGARGSAVAVVGDVSRRADVAGIVQSCVDRFGSVDILVQVAGIAEFVPFLAVGDASWDRVLDVNLRGTWLCVQEAARHMVASGRGGGIVITSSTNAFQPEQQGLTYNTSKAGQVAVMRTAAMELAPYGIRVNGVAPGIVNTRLSHFVIDDPVQSQVFLGRIPAGRFAQPEEIAAPILWLCSPEASYLYGHLLVVDGAMTSGVPEPGDAGVLADALQQQHQP